MKASVRWYEQRKGENKGGGEKHKSKDRVKKGKGGREQRRSRHMGAFNTRRCALCVGREAISGVLRVVEVVEERCHTF